MYDNELTLLLKKRATTHGPYRVVALVTMQIMHELASGFDKAHEKVENGPVTSIAEFTALNIVHKLVRAAYGDVHEVDHWKDIAGYATRMVEAIEQLKGVASAIDPTTADKVSVANNVPTSNAQKSAGHCTVTDPHVCLTCADKYACKEQLHLSPACTDRSCTECPIAKDCKFQQPEFLAEIKKVIAT